MTLAEQLDKARLVRFDFKQRVVLAWFGGSSTGIHVYSEFGEEINYWQIDLSIQGDPIDSVEDSMVRTMESGGYP
jgi:hypothetical protein